MLNSFVIKTSIHLAARKMKHSIQQKRNADLLSRKPSNNSEHESIGYYLRNRNFSSVKVSTFFFAIIFG